MKLLVLILHDPNFLYDILADFAGAGITGSTIIESTGMLQFICHDTVEPPAMFGSLREFLNPAREKNKTVLSVIKDEQVEIAREIVRKRTGGLDKPGTGIMFALNTTFADGIPS